MPFDCTEGLLDDGDAEVLAEMRAELEAEADDSEPVVQRYLRQVRGTKESDVKEKQTKQAVPEHVEEQPFDVNTLSGQDLADYYRGIGMHDAAEHVNVHRPAPRQINPKVAAAIAKRRQAEEADLAARTAKLAALPALDARYAPAHDLNERLKQMGLSPIASDGGMVFNAPPMKKPEEQAEMRGSREERARIAHAQAIEQSYQKKLLQSAAVGSALDVRTLTADEMALHRKKTGLDGASVTADNATHADGRVVQAGYAPPWSRR